MANREKLTDWFPKERSKLREEAKPAAGSERDGTKGDTRAVTDSATQTDQSGL